MKRLQTFLTRTEVTPRATTAGAPASAPHAPFASTASSASAPAPEAALSPLHEPSAGIASIHHASFDYTQAHAPADVTSATTITVDGAAGGRPVGGRGAELVGLPLVLKDVSVAVPRGQLTAIVGSVGSGKTTLIHGLLGELAPKSGSVMLSVTPAQTGYAPQRAVIISGTVQENVLFGRMMDAGKMHDALVCLLLLLCFFLLFRCLARGWY
jgi:ABC-type multidrug transport system fused ATPase/permease subunit